MPLSCTTLTRQSIKTALASAALAAPLAFPPLAAAQALTAPTPGLWQTQTRLHLNGQDFFAALRKMQQDALQSLSPAQRQQMQAMMTDPGAPSKNCLTAQEAARSRDPKTLLDDLSKDSPGCRFDTPTVSGNVMRFKGRCTDPQGFTGDLAGDMQMLSAKEWKATYVGKGSMDIPEGMKGFGAPGGLVEMRMETHSRWIAASCGNIAP